MNKSKDDIECKHLEALKWEPTIPEEAFEKLKQERPGVLRLPKVCALTGLSKSTVWDRTKKGTFPPAVKLGENCTAWREADVVAWLQGLQNVSESEVVVYDPKRWNEYPKVTPPEGVFMRVEFYKPGKSMDTPEPELPKILGRRSGIYDGKEWKFYGYGRLMRDCVIRFRPWEDEE